MSLLLVICSFFIIPQKATQVNHLLPFLFRRVVVSKKACAVDYELKYARIYKGKNID